MTDETSSESSATTRERLLEAARTLFSEKGYAATSTRELAVHAECNVALISHYFGSKEGLLRAVLAEGIGEMIGELSKLATRDDPPEKRIERLVDFMVGHFSRSHAGMRIVHNELMHSNSPILADLAPSSAAYLQVFVDILEQARESDNLRDIDPRVSAMLLMGMVQMYFIAYPLTSQTLGPMSPELLSTLKRHITNIFLHGVLAQGGGS